ncbi:MAG: hypothetical protein KGJ79_07075 [Alphaproteobacteria bacterium]|nr:hypothetical protein [Alphaproteobacteria bacterium]MDE2110887.1 hypothetical protein [Alphaproteobacteria bacterium]MDE2494116.1 hypothetical protein [Alphaproteobacteria bacterium]
MKEMFTRRRIMFGAGGVVVLAGAAYEGRRLLRKRYAPSPYDDLLALLDDRDADAQIGEAVLAGIDDFDAKAVSEKVRARLAHQPLARVAVADATEGRVLEADGWVIPETLALLCALTAKAD